MVEWSDGRARRPAAADFDFISAVRVLRAGKEYGIISDEMENNKEDIIARLAREDIKPAFAENNIPVALATDANYLQYLRVVVNSIVANSKKGNIDLLVLNDGIGEDRKRDFIASFSRVPNLSIRFVDVGDAILSTGCNSFQQVSHISMAALFRIYLPYLLTAYDKIVYLDIDLCVLGDIADLYNADIEGFLLGGVRDLGLSTPTWKDYVEWANTYGCRDWSDYINTGVLVMNLVAFRSEHGILGPLLSIACEASKYYVDRDAFNFVCKGHIRYLHPSWNYQVGDYCFERQLAATKEPPCICHWAGPKKPWNDITAKLDNLWWSYVSYEDGIRLWRKVFGDKPQVALGEGIAASVIIPIYNAEPYLAQTLLSYCAQTLSNIEIICVDDGSTDGSRAVCEKFAAFDSRIKVISQKNQGGAIARNHGMSEASGRWLFFGDADDPCKPEMLEKMVSDGERKNVDVVVAGWYVIDMKDGRTWEQKLPAQCVEKEDGSNCHADGIDVFSETNLAAWNKLFKSDFIRANGLVFHQIRSCDDIFFVCGSLIKATRITFMPSAYYYYRMNISTGQMGLVDKYPTNLFLGFLDVKPLLENEDTRLQSQFYALAVKNLLHNLFRYKTSQAGLALFSALKNGLIEKLAFASVDVSKVDLGEHRKYFDMILAGCDLIDLLQAKVADYSEQLKKEWQRVAHREEWLAAERKKVADRDMQLKYERLLVAHCKEKLAAEKKKVADRDKQLHEGLVKKLRALAKEFIPYAIERDYRRRHYGLVNHWDSRKTKGTLKKAARFCFELLPYGFVQRYSKKRYPEPLPKAKEFNILDQGNKLAIKWNLKSEHSLEPLVMVRAGLVPFVSEKPNCIIVAHESSRTGCPINTWSMLCELNKTFNVLAISLKPGPLDSIFIEKSTWCAIADESIRYKSGALETWLRPVLEARPYEFAIANSVCTWALLPVLSWHRIPSIVCIHEFAQYCNANDLKAAFLYGTILVYSSHLCLKATGDLLNIDVSNVPVVAQGKSGLPLDKTLRFEGRELYLITNIKRRKAENGEFVVLGVGSVEYRKGFDLFLRTAAEIQRKCSSRKFRFIWAGNGYNPEMEFMSKLYKAQIDTLGLSDSFEYLGPVKFIDKVYELSDLFLLTSVLDPLPGVVIEAMSHKVPVLCFDKTSGFPEMFQAAGLSDSCVVDYLSVEKMSERAVELIQDDDARLELAEGQYDFYLRSFDMPDYVARIVALAPKAREIFIARTKSIKRDSRDRFLEALRATTAREIGLADSSRTAYRARQFDELHPVIYGCKPSVKDISSHTTEELFFNLTGWNTGNLAFHRALYTVLAESPKVLRWHSEEPVPEGSVGILPCANQLGVHCDMSPFADWLLKYDIPMVAIGVGAQSQLKLGPSVLDYEIPYLRSGTISWIRRMADHAPTGKPNISARGRFTMDVLRSVGVAQRAVALGCPTLFISPDDKLGAHIAERCGKFGRIAFAAGQTSWGKTTRVENSLSKIITSCDGAFVVQAALPELKMVRGEFFSLDEMTRDKTRRHFREDLTEQEFADWCMRYGHVFFDVDEWMDFYRQFDFVVGPRIHGIMIALQAGVPAMCITIDSRTEELCEIMKVPYVPLKTVKDGVSLYDLKRLFKFDARAFDENRKKLAAGFVDFLRGNKIRPSLNLLRIAGRDS